MTSSSSLPDSRRQLQALLQQAAAPAPAATAAEIGHCIEIRGTGSARPVVCVAGGGAAVPSFRRLSELLPDVPLYATQLISAANMGTTIENVEARGEAHRQILEQRFPRGPYILCGHSFGATIAYEVAQQLTARGEQVLALFVLDQPGPDVRLTIRHWLYWQWVAISHLSWKMRAAFVLDGIRFRLRTMPWLPESWRNRLFAKRNFRRRVQPRQRPSSHQYRRTMTDSVMKALRAYRPAPSSFPMVLVRARSGTPRIHSDPQGGWGQVARGGLQVLDLPGTHMQLFEEPSLSALAKSVREFATRSG